MNFIISVTIIIARDIIAIIITITNNVAYQPPSFPSPST